MAGFAWLLKIKDLGAEKMLKGMDSRVDRRSGFLAAAGNLILRSIDQNFQAGGRPKKWKPRSPKYGARMRARGKTKVLIVNGDLMNSVTAQTKNDTLLVGSNLIYARIHQKGGQAGKNLSATIPARPFLVAQETDTRRLTKMFANWVLRGKA